MKTLLTLCIFFMMCTSSYGQQDPIYSLYLNNPFVVNPAYAGHEDLLHAQLSYRTQWVGIEGNAKTANFSSHSSVRGNKAGVGIQIIQDVIGENKNSEVQASFSYKLRLSSSLLSFGLQAGVINFASNPGDLTIRHPGDPYFTRYSEYAPNIGAGMMLSSNRYVFGLSSPRMLPARIRQSGEQIEVYSPTLYFTGAYVFPISAIVKFKPAVLLRAMKANPVSADIQANFLMNDSYTVGLFTRNLHTYGAIGSIKFRNVRVGYVFEMPTNRSVSSQFSSHEIMLAIKAAVFRFHDKQNQQ